MDSHSYVVFVPDSECPYAEPEIPRLDLEGLSEIDRRSDEELIQRYMSVIQNRRDFSGYRQRMFEGGNWYMETGESPLTISPHTYAMYVQALYIHQFNQRIQNERNGTGLENYMLVGSDISKYDLIVEAWRRLIPRINPQFFEEYREKLQHLKAHELEHVQRKPGWASAFIFQMWDYERFPVLTLGVSSAPRQIEPDWDVLKNFLLNGMDIEHIHEGTNFKPDRRSFNYDRARAEALRENNYIANIRNLLIPR